MLKIMQEELLTVAGGHMSVNALMMNPGSMPHLPSDETSLISASLKWCQSVVICTALISATFTGKGHPYYAQLAYVC